MTLRDRRRITATTHHQSTASYLLHQALDHLPSYSFVGIYEEDGHEYLASGSPGFLLDLSKSSTRVAELLARDAYSYESTSMCGRTSLYIIVRTPGAPA